MAAILLGALALVSASPIDDRDALRKELSAWKASDAGVYAAANGLLREHLDGAGEDAELAIFAANKAAAVALQEAHPLAEFSVDTPFALLTSDEFASYVGTASPARNASALSASSEGVSVATNTVDWRTSGCVAPVKVQGGCGSCYAFSAVAATESAYCLAHHRRRTLFSEQQTASCGPGNGCQGGFEFDSLKWIATNGLCTSEAYPYTNGQSAAAHPCQSTCQKLPMPFLDVPLVRGEDALEKALNTQPVAVAVAAGNSAWQLYKRGILTGGCDGDISHAVLAVGYGAADSPYFMIKNSWGNRWGEYGFMRLQRGVGGHGLCRIAEDISYPMLRKPQFYLVTSHGHVITEFYSDLYASSSTKSGAMNEEWSYDFTTRQIIVHSNYECLDAYNDGGTYRVHTYKCDASNPNQRWSMDNYRVQHLHFPNLCLDVDPNQNHKVQVWSCAENAPNQRITGVWDEKVTLRSFNQLTMGVDGDNVQFNGGVEWGVSVSDDTWRARTGDWTKCLDAYDARNGGAVHLYPCDGSNLNQKWRYDPATKQLKHLTHAGFCLDMGSEAGTRAHLYTCNTAIVLQLFDRATSLL